MVKTVAILILIGIGFGTRFISLGHPNQVVFDEVHFGKFVTAYCCSHQRIFDIHPPHGKLLVAGAGYLLGYRGGFDFDHIGEPYGNIPVFALRFLPALAGALLSLVIFGILRTVGVSPELSFLGGLAIALDNAQIVQSRLIGMDSLLLLFEFGAILAALKAFQPAATSGESGATPEESAGRFWWLVLAGALAGLAIGVKVTGLAALAVVIVIIVHGGIRNLESGIWRRARVTSYWLLITISTATLAYLAGWAIHFSLLTNPGPGDAWGVPTGNLVENIIAANKTMLHANSTLTATHPYASAWYAWPVMARSIFYWSGAQGQWIYFLGNPVVWWGASGLLLAAIFNFQFSIFKHKQAWIFLAGYLISYVPLMRVTRVLFLYHYLTPLIFSVLLGAWWLDKTIVDLPAKRRVAVTGAVLLALGFIIFIPVTYGFHGWQTSLMWFGGWR